MLDKETVRAASRIEDVIPALGGETLNGANGSREPVVRCLLHKDQRPSLRVNLDKQRWYCDPCGIGGDVFELVQRVRGVEFSDALRWLADHAGLSASKQGAPRWVHVRDFLYTDEAGQLLYRKRRHEDARGSVGGKKREKRFVCERWDAESQTWHKGIDGVRRVPYLSR